MAVTYQSHSTKTFSSASNLIIDKPTGLAVGDLMVSHCNAYGPSAMAGNQFNTPSGWTALASTGGYHTGGNVSYFTKSFCKIANSSDVAASNFTFAFQTTANLGGAIYRISGANSTPVSVYSSATTGSDADSSSPFSGAATVTPGEASSLLLFLTAGTSAVSSFSSQAIQNDNPTWTEDYDFGPISGSHATRTQTTATGNASYNFTDGGTTVNGVMILVVRPPVAVTISPDVVTVTSSLQSPTVKVGVSIAPSVLTVTSSISDPTVSREIGWSNESKNSSTWTNQSKSS